MRVATLVLPLLLAGCVAAVNAPPEAAPGVLPDLSDLQSPDWDTSGTRAWWETFVRAHPYRHAGSPTNIQASDHIAADLAEAGYDVRVLYYVPSYGPLPPGGPSPAAHGYRTIVGVKEGATLPDHVVAWVAHYDSHRNTVYAAYDDGSGTAIAMELARELASYPNEKTLMAIFFDAEEMGLVASKNFVQQVSTEREYTFDMVIGHDMTGINCPGHAWPMYQMVGENFADVLLPIERALYKEHLGLDVGEGEDATNCIVLLDVHDRNSDERHFKEAGIPVLRMAGGRHAADYPEYHKPGDTVEFVYEFVGGPENFEKGLRTVLETSWWNVVTFDRLPPLVG